jgi:hypothetical protein
VVLLIKEDVNGIFFSMDAILGLIPIIILILTIANTNINYSDSCLEKQYFQRAQDTAELMATYKELHDDQTILEKVSNALSKNQDKKIGIESARTITSPFLERTVGNMKYRLEEINYLKGSEIISNGDINKAENVGVAVKCYDQYLFKFYLWE